MKKKFLFHGYDFFSIIFIPLIIFILVRNLGQSTNPTFLHKESQLKAAWLIFTHQKNIILLKGPYMNLHSVKTLCIPLAVNLGLLKVKKNIAEVS